MYATLENLIDLYSADTVRQLTDKMDTGSINEALVDLLLTEATSLIDGKLKVRYPLPLANVPPETRRYCCWIVRRLMEPDAGDNVIRDYKEAMQWLDDIADGKIILAGNNPAPTPAPSIGGFASDPRQLTKSTLEGF